MYHIHIIQEITLKCIFSTIIYQTILRYFIHKLKYTYTQKYKLVFFNYVTEIAMYKRGIEL